MIATDYPIEIEEDLKKLIKLGDFTKAKQQINDWYLSLGNQSEIITKAENIKPSSGFKIPEGDTVEIRLSKNGIKSAFIYWLIVFLFFSGLCIASKSWWLMLIPALFTFSIIAPLYRLLTPKKKSITLTTTHLELSKSGINPIRWDNILAIYFYQHGVNGNSIDPGGEGSRSAGYIQIHKKDDIDIISIHINFQEYIPSDLVFLINEFWKKQ